MSAKSQHSPKPLTAMGCVNQTAQVTTLQVLSFVIDERGCEQRITEEMIQRACQSLLAGCQQSPMWSAKAAQ